MRRLLIGGNWKMQKGIRETREFAKRLLKKELNISNIDVFIAPPFTSIPAAIEEFAGSRVTIGAQNMFWEEDGAYTGEISPVFLKELGVEWVIIGHSERRRIFGEMDKDLRKKIKMALHSGLKVVICIGETEEEREEKREKEVVEKQLKDSLFGIELDPESISIAYEPLWAIGTGKTAEPTDAEEMHRAIRGLLGKKGEEIRIIYGGSVKPHNAEELLKQDNIDGALIGGASLDPEVFAEIVEVAGRVSC
ncbi:triose-phosphate isomerase [candidate division WOR-3 bacterium]|nr:triose-phosphate isomerase [candidate division WOR-3 bacterium]